MSELKGNRAKVAALFPSAITDRSWSQFGYEGLMKAKADYGLEVAYSESVPEDEQLELIRGYAEAGYGIILGHGGEFSTAMQAVASGYPNIEFGVANGKTASRNLSVICLNYAQMGYLRGALAAEMTKTGRIAMVSAYKASTVIRDEEAFTRAAQTCKKHVETMFAYTGDMEDPEKARQAALAMIADGVDVLTHHLDSGDAGVIAAAQEKGVYAIGLYRDSSLLGPKAVIGSALGSPGTLLYELAGGRALNGNVSYLDVNTPDGIDLHMTDLVPLNVQEMLREVLRMMRSGEIQIEP